MPAIISPRAFFTFSVLSLGACLSATLSADNHKYGGYAEFADGFGELSTLAGRGQIRAKYRNGWETRFEGMPASQAELSRPHHAMDDGRGNILVIDKDAHALRRINTDGSIQTIAGTNRCGDGEDKLGQATEISLCYPNGLWVSGNGTSYILDTGNGKVRRLTRDGQITTLFKDPDGIETGRGLWVSDDETLVYYSSGQRLMKWQPDKGSEVMADGFRELANLAVSPTGELFVTDRKASRVYAISANGEKRTVAGNGKATGGGDGYPATETGLYEVRGIWFHPNGGYFLATHKGGQIWFVSPSGIIHRFVDGGRDHQHSGDGLPFYLPGEKISEPRSVALDSQGNLIITESDFGFIRRVAHKGAN
ncbi:hypothetical protein [Ferrimonas sp. YFM]|uniref:hypothetical protein n=1 Tax=Ferrimonas sp. YFM TaxID=3028878 RepID=UPI0025734527|nr:hypothetical protein [Ferrimonas sp. YFM]BDY06022.1 hypothetical protein F0521_30630 [Ferrimonas sp. YFM]